MSFRGSNAGSDTDRSAQPVPIPDLARGAPRDRLPRGELLYRIYLAVVLGGIYGSVLVQALRTAVVPPLDHDGLTLVGALALLGVCLAALGGVRFGRWAGPVPVSRPEVSILLPAPIARRQLFLPRLRQSYLAVLAISVAGGLASVVLLGLSFQAGAGAWFIVPVLAGICGSVATGTSALFQATPLQANAHRRVSLAIIAALCLLAVAGVTEPVRDGLAVLGDGIVGDGVAVPALVLLVVTATVAGLVGGYGRAALLRIHDEELAARAGLHSGLAASARMGDLRAITSTRDPTARARRLAALPYPRRPAWAVAWRQATTLRAHPSPLLRCAAGWSVATALIVLAPADAGFGAIVLRVALAVGALYVGAAPLLEPLRREHDSPLAAELLPFGFAALNWMHIRAATVTVAAVGYLSATVTMALAAGGVHITMLLFGVPLAALTTVIVLADRVRKPTTLPELLLQMPLGAAPEAVGVMLAVSLVQPLIAMLPIALPIGLSMAAAPFSDPAALVAASLAGLGLVNLRVVGLGMWLRRFEEALHDAELLSPSSSMTLASDHVRHRLAHTRRRRTSAAPGSDPT